MAQPPGGRFRGRPTRSNAPEEDAVVTGILEELGEIVVIERAGDSARLTVRGPLVTGDGVDGISLTISALGESGGEHWFEVSLIPATLERTTLGSKQPGAVVNLEVDMIAKYVERLLAGRTL